MVEPSKPEDWSNPKHAPEIGLEGETGTMKTADENTTKMAEYEYESGASTKIRNTAAKSCKGLLYSSSRFKAHSKNPICVGFTRSLPNYPEVHLNIGRVLFRLESKEDRTTTLANFRFACVGYSAYADQKGDNNFNGQDIQTELPGCIGLQAVLHDGQVNRKGLHSLLERIIPNSFMIDAIDVSASGATMSTPSIYSLLYALDGN